MQNDACIFPDERFCIGFYITLRFTRWFLRKQKNIRFRDHMIFKSKISKFVNLHTVRVENLLRFALSLTVSELTANLNKSFDHKTAVNRLF